MSIQESIQNILNETSTLVSNDILVDIGAAHVFKFDLPSLKSGLKFNLTSDLISIVQNAESTHRDSGILPVCLCNGVLKWEYKDKKIESPLFLFPLSVTKNKIKKQVGFDYFEEDVFLNPFIKNQFKNAFNTDVPDFEYSENLCEKFDEWLRSIEFNGTVKELSVIGNFHHHRYQIIKDLEGLANSAELGKNVSRILGKEDDSVSFSFVLPSDNLFPTDNDQSLVFEEITRENCVIQGPPGTGKSQVLSNILGKVLYSSHNALVVSEKRAALDVLQKKLAHFNLDDFSFITTSETLSKDFIASLKKTWERLEKTQSKNAVNLKLSEQYIQQLQLQLDLLSQKDLIGGIGFDEFHDLTKATEFAKAPFFSDGPSMKDWLKDKESIVAIYKAGLHEIVRYLPFEALKNDRFEKLDTYLEEWKISYRELSANFDIETVEDIQKAMKTAAVCQVIENESGKSYAAVLNPDTKERKKYTSLKKKWAALQLQIQKAEYEKYNWSVEPSENEAQQLIDALNSSSFFKKRKAKKRIGELTKSGFVEPQTALVNWLTLLDLKKQDLQLKHEFSEIGIQSAATDLPAIDSLTHRLDKNDWKLYASLIPEKRRKMCDFHSHLQQFNSILKTYFQVTLETSVNHLFAMTSRYFEDLSRFRSQLVSLEKASYRLIGKVNTPEEYKHCVFKSNQVKFESHFPLLAQFKPCDLHSKINRIILQQEEESKVFVQQIEYRIFSNFQAYQQLLRTPAHKLSDEQKVQKQNLRKGKSILVKEFGKTRSHPSIRELLQTEASAWIHLLKPVWLSNPTQIAKCFPLEKELFDFVIFDEATQIPLSNALGSLHRGKRIIVAGDEQQMSATSYFKPGSAESPDVLHQAGFYWKNTYLKHHYRSEHPDLIAFSNNHFYQNSLLAYPSGNAVDHPIHFHYCETGIFEDRKNEEEAKLVARLIEATINKSSPIGIVAFSETQLKCIREQLNPLTEQLLNERIEKGEGFVKALEHVQGDECDHLIISLGYGKNKNGEFPLRFGPLNQKSGSKRLNVLLSRAKKSIDFAASVTASDFKISENETINLLRLFIQQIADQKSGDDDSAVVFPYGLLPTIEKGKNHSKVYFKSIYSTLTDANELVTFQRVLENRNWKINYI